MSLKKAKFCCYVLSTTTPYFGIFGSHTMVNLLKFLKQSDHGLPCLSKPFWQATKHDFYVFTLNFGDNFCICYFCKLFSR